MGLRICVSMIGSVRVHKFVLKLPRQFSYLEIYPISKVLPIFTYWSIFYKIEGRL